MTHNKETINKLETWLRFFTDNSTNEEYLFNKIDVGYNVGVRRNIAKDVSEYFKEIDNEK